MNSQLQAILEKIEQSDALSNVEKEFYRERINEIDKKDNLPEFKTDRIEKERHSLSVMLEESIENLQRKAKSIEAQKRELEIEAALERVRTKAMAMQKSDELTEVAELLFKEINDLGVKPWTTGFNVWSDDNNSYTDYITNPQGGFMPPYTIDATVLPVFIEMSNAKKEGLIFS